MLVLRTWLFHADIKSNSSNCLDVPKELRSSPSTISNRKKHQLCSIVVRLDEECFLNIFLKILMLKHISCNTGTCWLSVYTVHGTTNCQQRTSTADFGDWLMVMFHFFQSFSSSLAGHLSSNSRIITAGSEFGRWHSELGCSIQTMTMTKASIWLEGELPSFALSTISMVFPCLSTLRRKLVWFKRNTGRLQVSGASPAPSTTMPFQPWPSLLLWRLAAFSSPWIWRSCSSPWITASRSGRPSGHSLCARACTISLQIQQHMSWCYEWGVQHLLTAHPLTNHFQ